MRPKDTVEAVSTALQAGYRHLNFKLSDGDVAEISALDKNERTGPDPCCPTSMPASPEPAASYTPVLGG